MIAVDLPLRGTAAAWRDAARRLVSHRIAPVDVRWTVGGGTADLFAADGLPAVDGPHQVHAPARFVNDAALIACHHDTAALAALHRALDRHQRDPAALGNPADALTAQLARLGKSVRRDIHKMHAFVRFREMPSDGPRRRFAAWFEPDHRIVEAAAPFFAKRFADMDWLIATPWGTVAHETGVLSFGDSAPRPDLDADASEALWGVYFANIFNPARIKLDSMRGHMPRKYWHNLPETRLIPEMLAAAEGRVARMRDALPDQPPAFATAIAARRSAGADQGHAESVVPESLADAAEAARGCTRCELCHAATQTVWGEGNPDSGLMLVGEQPGDHEDLQGRPFVGPAGQLLRTLLADAGAPSDAYLTNAVKHFRFLPRGKKRLHQNPSRSHIEHCRWWLDLERRFVAPRLTVALGASASLALTGDAGALGPRRGRLERARDGGPVLITWHPSLILRAAGPEAARVRAELAADLQMAVGLWRDTAAAS